MSAKEAQAQAGAESTVAADDFMESIFKATRSRDEDTKTRTRSLVEAYAQELVKGATVGKDALKTINLRIAEIDRLLSAQLNEILHNQEFQRLEASWRGLHHLVHQSETGETLKIRVLNASKKDLLNDLEKASEFDQMHSSRKSTKMSTASLAGLPTARSSATMNSASTCRTWR